MIEKQKSMSSLERAVAGGDYGAQPLDALIVEHRLSNSDVVEASPEPVTHKMINKARRGRRLSRKVQLKVLAAFNQAMTKLQSGEDSPCYTFPDLFNYDGR
jgi:hypothetical protein